MPQLQPHDWLPQVIWLALTFTFLYLMMSRIALPRIGAAIDARRERIVSDLQSAEKLKRQTEEAIAAYEQAIAEARSRAHGIANETRDKLNAELAKERSKVDEELAKSTAAAEERIRVARDEAMGHVGEIASTTAREIVEALIGVKATDAELATAIRKT